MKEKKSPLKIFNEFVESLKQAEGACSQLIHLAGQPHSFMVMRDALNLTIEGCMSIAPHNEFMKPRTVYVKG